MGNRSGGSKKKTPESVYKYIEPYPTDPTSNKVTDIDATGQQRSYSAQSNFYRQLSTSGHSNGHGLYTGSSAVGSASSQAYPSAPIQNHLHKSKTTSTGAPPVTKFVKTNNTRKFSLFLAFALDLMDSILWIQLNYCFWPITISMARHRLANWVFLREINWKLSINRRKFSDQIVSSYLDQVSIRLVFCLLVKAPIFSGLF